MNLAEVKQIIHDHEYYNNGCQHLNGAGVDVRNLKRIKGGYKADVLLFIEDITERHYGCEYPDSLFQKAEAVK